MEYSLSKAVTQLSQKWKHNRAENVAQHKNPRFRFPVSYIQKILYQKKVVNQMDKMEKVFITQ